MTDPDKDLDIARDLARAGVPIFVAHKDSTHPTGFRIPNNWQHAEAHPDAIDAWRPGDALCAVMGVVCDGIDVDAHKGGTKVEHLLRAASLWPRSHGRVLTPSGGTHDYIARLRVGSKDNFDTGLDIKGGRDGDIADAGRGFLFMPPTERRSKVDGEARAYTWEDVPDLGAIDDDDSGEALAELVRDRLTTGAQKPPGDDEPGQEHDTLTDAQRVSVAHYIDKAVYNIQTELRQAKDWGPGHQDHKGRGWQKLQADAAYRLGALARAPWNTLTYDDAIKAFMAAAATDRKWTKPQAKATFIAHYRRDDPAPWPTKRLRPAAEAPPEPVKPRTLDEAHGVFRRWLGATYGLDALDIMLSVAAVENLDGDPAWLLILSGPGNAKTELVSSLAGAGATVTSTISSEGALLSGTAKHERAGDATGGLLRKLGSRGIVVIKDFTTIISMNRDSRAAVLAALREVCDQKWERNLGADGGQSLLWTGRIVFIGAVTSAYDDAHGVISAMGDRFALVRIDSNVGREEAGMQALANVGREVQMRAELAEVVAGALAGVRPERAVLSGTDNRDLMHFADLVTLVRTAVKADFKGEPLEAHQPEAPTRFAKTLAQVARGALSLGVDHDRAMELARRVAHDSMPPMRRRVLEAVVADPGGTTADYVKAVQESRSTVDRTLKELLALKLLSITELAYGERTRWQWWPTVRVDQDALLVLTGNVSTRGYREEKYTSEEPPPDEDDIGEYLPTDIPGQHSPPGVPINGVRALTRVTATCTVGVRRPRRCLECDGPLDPELPWGAIECAKCARECAELADRLASRPT